MEILKMKKLMNIPLYKVVLPLILAVALTAAMQVGFTHISNLYVDHDMTVGEDLTIIGGFDVDGATTLDALDVDGATTLNSTLDVDSNVTSGTGSFTVTDTVNITGAVDLDSTLNVDGNTTLNGTLDVDGVVTSGTGSFTVSDSINVTGAADFDSTLNVDGNLSSATGALTVTDTLELGANQISQSIGAENLGVLPSVVSTAFTYTAAAGGSGTVATIADGEIWIVHRVIISITTDFDATGDDVTLDIGDGGDADGHLNLADADLQKAATDYTGAQAGWQGLDGATPAGVYMIGGPHVYSPSGSAETIDWLLDEASGETITAGAATIYVEYTRIQ